MREYTGLSEYEARAYVHLALTGPAKASEISVTCGIPRTKVYAALNRLEDQGMICRVPSEPQKFMSESPIRSLDSYLASLKEKERDLQHIVSVLENRHRKRRDSPKIFRGEVWIFEGRREVVEKVREMLSQARKSVFIVSSGVLLVLLYTIFNKTFDTLWKRGVKLRFGTSVDSYSRHVASELQYIGEVRSGDFKSPVLLVLVNGKEFLLAKLEAQTELKRERGSKKELGVFSTNPKLGKILADFFEASTGDKMKKKAEVIST